MLGEAAAPSRWGLQYDRADIAVLQALGLRKEKRHMQEEINRLEARIASLISRGQEVAGELSRLKLSCKDLSLEKMEHEIEIERLQFQLR